jgi:hypothetical protein
MIQTVMAIRMTPNCPSMSNKYKRDAVVKELFFGKRFKKLPQPAAPDARAAKPVR